MCLTSVVVCFVACSCQAHADAAQPIQGSSCTRVCCPPRHDRHGAAEASAPSGRCHCRGRGNLGGDAGHLFRCAGTLLVLLLTKLITTVGCMKAFTVTQGGLSENTIFGVSNNAFLMCPITQFLVRLQMQFLVCLKMQFLVCFCDRCLLYTYVWLDVQSFPTIHDVQHAQCTSCRHQASWRARTSLREGIFSSAPFQMASLLPKVHTHTTTHYLYNLFFSFFCFFLPSLVWTTHVFPSIAHMLLYSQSQYTTNSDDARSDP